MNNFELMRRRLEWQGGVAQENRMIQGKYNTFLKALKYSYQACTTQLVWNNSSEATPNQEYPQVRALINPDKLKQDYDDKTLSIDGKYEGYKPGDVFEWVGTDSYWLIYLQALTEDAYFRSSIRRCRYRINFLDQDGNKCETWAAIRGPVETQIESIQKNQIRIDTPNLSLNILMPRNEATLYAFDRYKEFLFAGKCWRVQAPDSISMDGILEVNAEEYYISKMTDDVENALKDGLVIAPADPTPDSGIRGNTFIKPKIAESYSVDLPEGNWRILEEVPVRLNVTSSNSLELIWDKTTSGQFTLIFQNDETTLEKTIVVESLF